MIKNLEELKNAPAYYSQVFCYKFSHYVEKNAIITAKEEDGFDDIDMAIFKFLFKFKYATIEQLYRYLTYKGLIDSQYTLTMLNNKISTLINNYRCMNKFGIAVDESEKLTNDNNALIIYCLDIGGQFLLYNYTDENIDEIRNWRAKAANIHTPNIIYKDIMITELYLKLLSLFKDDLRYFIPYRKMMNAQRETVTVDFDFMIEVDGQNKMFFGDIIRDGIYSYTTQADFIETLVSTNGWKRYYTKTEEPPIYIGVAEDESMMLELCEILAQRNITKFRTSTTEKMMEDLSKAFYVYKPETRTIENKIVKMFMPK